MEVQLSFKMDVFSKLRKMKILLIDDDEWIRDSLSIFFEAEGCQLMAFETAEEGIDELKDQTYDLIIVDYKLPGLDGLEFIKRTQNALSDAIKVLITAYRNDKVVSEAKKLKVQGFIEKPFTSDSFMASLVHLIAMHEYREQKKILEDYRVLWALFESMDLSVSIRLFDAIDQISKSDAIKVFIIINYSEKIGCKEYKVSVR